jgi:hypothetical protein
MLSAHDINIDTIINFFIFLSNKKLQNHVNGFGFDFVFFILKKKKINSCIFWWQNIIFRS